jgi:hypothetical protein
VDWETEKGKASLVSGLCQLLGNLESFRSVGDCSQMEATNENVHPTFEVLTFFYLNHTYNIAGF